VRQKAVRWIEPRTDRLPERITAALEGKHTSKAEHPSGAEVSNSFEDYRFLFESNPLPMFFVDSKARTFLAVNEAAIRRYGYSRDEFLAMTVTDMHPPDDFPALLETLSKLHPGSHNIGIWKHRKKDGTIIEVEIHIQRFIYQGRLVSYVVANDMTAHRRADRLLTAQYEVMRTLGESDNLVDAAPKILRSLVESLEWDVGGLWTMEPESNLLGCFEMWHAAGMDTAEFEKWARRTPLSLGVDVPGRVCATGQAIWIQDLARESDLLCAAEALRGGLHAALGFPIVHGSKILGVLTLYSRKVRELDLELLQASTALGGLIGQFVERNLAQERLRLSDEILQRVSSLILVSNSHGEIHYASPSIKAVLGYEPEEVLGNGWWNRTRDDPEARAQARDVLMQFAQDERRLTTGPYEQEIKTRAGDKRCVLWQDAKGPGGLIFGVGQDITERKRVEESLRASEKRFFTVFNSSPNPMCIISLSEGRYLEVNQAFLRYFETTREDAIGRTQRELELWDNLDDLMRMARMLRDEGALHNFEVHLRTKKGAARIGLVSTEIINLDDQQCVLTVISDITELKRAEAETLLQTARLRQLFENSPLGIVMADERGNVMHLNKGFEAIFQYGLEELQGRTLNAIIVPEELTEEGMELDARSLRGEVITRETKRRRKDGTLIPVQIYGVPVIVDQKPAGVYAIYVDLTEPKRLEEELQQSQKMDAVGQLAGGIAHDFNNLLTAITGYSELLLMRLSPEDSLRHLAAEIAKAAERASSLTYQLLVFSRKQVVLPRVVDLNTLAAETEQMLRRLIGEHIELVTRLGHDLGKIKADPGQIIQILMNLCVNARDAMPQGGRLTIETENLNGGSSYLSRAKAIAPGKYVKLSVTDTGCGMDAVTQSHMFEPFFTTKEKGKGTGLGLSTVYGIVKQSGGYIEVQSEVGRGTTFRVYLPRLEESVSVADSTGDPQTPASGDETVLLVEDEESVRNLVRSILEMNGYAVLEASDGKDALGLCRKFKGTIHLMISDVVMPQMSGRELAEHLSTVRPEMKVLFMSGYTEDAILHQRALKSDAAFLQKPFTPAALAGKIREVLDAAEPASKASVT
jgi:two-component system cell cycle sensor histidine kinase/response regulator CckA